MLPEGAMLSRLCHAELKFRKPKKRDRRGEAEPRLIMSENDAWLCARFRRSPPVMTLPGRGDAPADC